MASVNNTTSTSSYSYLQYKNKIGGLVSGMDVDSIMEKLMKAESAQMEKLQQQKQKYEWKRDAYREVNTKLNTFQEDLFDDYGLQSSWNTKTVTTSANTAISVKAGSTARGNLSVSEVIQASAASQAYLSNNVGFTHIDENTKLGDIVGLVSTDLTIFGKTFDSTSSIKDIVDHLNTKGYTASISKGQLNISTGENAVAFDPNTRVSLENLGLKFNITSDKLTVGTGSNAEAATKDTKLSDLGLSGILKINVTNASTTETKEINLSGLSTVNDLLEKIKSQGLNASISDGKISISSTDSGSKIALATDSGLTNTFKPTLASTTGSSLVKVLPSGATDSEKMLKSTNTIHEVLGGSAQDGKFTIQALQADGSMKLTTISYKATDTMESLMSKINSSSAGATAIFNDGKFSISANNTGDNASGAEVGLVTSATDASGNPIKDSNGDTISIDSNAIKLFKSLTGRTVDADGYQIDKDGNFLDKDGKVTTDIANATKDFVLAGGGTQAKLTVNGVTYTQNSNIFKVAGYEITATGNLVDTTSTNSSPISISSAADTDKAVEKVKAFVDMYNTLIKDINTRVTEKKKGYEPLTDAQKAEMTTDEITKWETASKAGLLKGDSTLNSVISKMRQTLFTYGTSTVGPTSKEPLGIKGENLANIGITTSKTWSDNGKLEIDEDKLRDAVEKDPDILSRIFAGDGTDENPGIISQIRKTAQAAITSIKDSAGSENSSSDLTYSLGKTITSLDDKIDDWKDRLKDIEERYWNQFSAMETAIQKANSQSSIFSQG